MRMLLALLALAAACNAPKPRPESPIVNEGSAVPEACCCKSSPLTSEDGRPVYEPIARMECSARQGTCVDDAQCNAPPAP
jgi:hypothetical protein